ncbi:hypothetical protein [Kitasatospora purpeofusca]|uniref:hypothetical protein n=1 Tax=Kitasatospora purpeofusca TaxID=67352 RepID=UPI002A599E7F|nr:hypothetical protein [Kitasatospora purpeofusca]MDY0813565.1 hypothetical protein [Kitasatospora purpeofusca]
MPVEDGFEDDFEDGFAQALHGAAAFAPEAALFALAAGAERRGRRRRNRRRAAMAGGAALAVLVVGGLGAFTGGPGPGALGPVAEPPVTGDEVVRLVAGLLPPGAVADARGTTPGDTVGSNGPQLAMGLFTYDDGKGVSLIHYFVERGARTPEQAAVCKPPVAPEDSCDRSVRPDGSVLLIDKSGDARFAGQRAWRGVYATPGGTVISLVEFNGSQESPTREQPPLDAAQLAAVVTAPEWGRVVAAIPANPNAPKASGSERPPSTATAPTAPPSTPAASPAPPSPVTASPAPGESLPELAAVLAGLLPTGAKEVGMDTENGAVTVEYEGRTSRLTIRAEPAEPRGIEFKIA